MPNRTSRAPWWVLSLLTGILFGGFMTVSAVVRDDAPWSEALVPGLLAGAFFGVVMGAFARWEDRRAEAAMASVPAGVRRAAARAVRRGPVPTDPEVRAAALRLVDHQLTELRRQRSFTVGVLSAFTLLYVVLAAAQTPWWALAAVLFGVALAATVVLPRRLRRRRELLRGATTA